MEYRKRQKRIRSRRLRHDSYAGTVFCVVLLFAAIVYLIGVSSAGTWMAKTVVAPVFRTLGIGLNADQALNQQTVASISPPVTETLSFDEKQSYALQMGVYTSLENASKQAAALQALGAGGYICNDDGKYRVLAACYPDETALSAVRSQLSAEGLESSTYIFDQKPAEWIVTADKSQIKSIKDAMECLLSIDERIYAIIHVFDSEKQDVRTGVASLSVLQSELKDKMTTLSSVGSNQAAERLLSCCNTVYELLSETAAYDGDETVIFSSKLKNVHLSVTDTVCRFFAAMEE